MPPARRRSARSRARIPRCIIRRCLIWACDTVPGLTLNFSNSQSLVQGVIMGEVLRRPEFKNGRRVIH